MATKKPKSPAEKVHVAAVVRDDVRYLYYVDKNCNVARMERGVARAETEIIVVTGKKREKGYDYYLDADGDIARELE